jgi:adenylate kinase
MNIVLLGPPGCGKGTQAEFLINRYKLKHVAPGDFIREEIHSQTEVGKQVQQIVASGHMIDEHIVMNLITKHVTQKSHLLFDGVPRTVTQAALLQESYSVDIVLDIQVSEAEVVKRISSRWAVEVNGEQHTFSGKVAAENFAQQTKGRLFQREDDKPETVKERLAVYHKETEPLITYYGEQHKLFIINGEKSVASVSDDIARILDKLLLSKLPAPQVHFLGTLMN